MHKYCTVKPSFNWKIRQMTKKKNVCIILVNYNGYADTIECIDSLLNSNYLNFNILVCDNNSTDNSIRQIKKYFSGKKIPVSLLPSAPKHSRKHKLSKINLLQSSRNIGFAGGNNLATEAAFRDGNFEYIWYLNNDTTVDKNTLFRLVESAETAGPGTGIIGAKLLYYHTPDTIQAVGGKFNRITGQPKHIGQGEKDLGQYNNPALQMDYVVGASMFVPAELIRKIGMMPEYYFLYYEELDWIASFRKQGYRNEYCPKAVVYHKEGASTKSFMKNKKSFISSFYGTRSSIIYNYYYNRLFIVCVFAYTIAVLISKLLRLEVNPCKGMTHGIISAFKFIISGKRASI